MKIPGLGEVTGYVEAWRAWRAKTTDGELRSVTMGDSWPRREVKKACCMDDLCGRHDKFGTCGLWATKYRPEFGDIIARVALWGEVIEHENGYRAEFCYPIAFFWDPRKADPTKLAEAWGIEVEKPDYDELWQIAAKVANQDAMNRQLSILRQQQWHANMQQLQNSPFQSGLLQRGALGLVGAGFWS